ncbi:COG4315 family predicted lipoprotein [Actinomadura macrotermitis]|uniref:Lipoprotein n=1 Tax=Actinomadura macrotermitis TaxID=2585200 RepID=A0A7K0C819_9ACTN|nr:hypothetical protein [Actinomadura macrotermitis]MQY09597.1 hypothetical protein [Actinomadura macrotermitis]
MKKLLAAGVAGLAVLAGCGNPDTENMDTPGRTLAAAPRSGPALVALGGTAKGPALVDGLGRALYLFAGDGARRSSCDGDCARMWPPYLTDGRPVAGAGVPGGRVGSVERAGGFQATYAGHPLYRFVKDRFPGDANGHGLHDFGDRWYLVGLDGRRVQR